MRKRIHSQSAPPSPVSQRIREVMGDLTQAEFASEVHSTQTTISKVLSGSMPSSSLLIAISKRFGVSTDWILGLSDNKYVSGASTEQLLYSDVVPVLAGLLDKGSITYRTETKKENVVVSEEGNVVTNEFTIYLLEIKDAILKDCISLASHTSRVDGNTYAYWIKSMKENYRREVLRWSPELEDSYQSYRARHKRQPDMLIKWLKSLEPGANPLCGLS